MDFFHIENTIRIHSTKMTESQKLAYNAWKVERDMQHAGLRDAVDRSLRDELNLRKVLNPESDEYEYLVGKCKMWDHRIKHLRKNYNHARYEVRTYEEILSR